MDKSIVAIKNKCRILIRGLNTITENTKLQKQMHSNTRPALSFKFEL